jgi:hypothetical protein
VAGEAGLELEVDRDGRATAMRCGGQRLDQGGGADGGAEVERDDALGVLGGRVAEDDHRGVDAGPAKLLGLVDAYDAEGGRAGRERLPGGGDGAMPVAVRLDDRPEPGRRGACREQPDVVGERVEVDLGPHGPAAPRDGGSRHGAAS